MAPLGFDEIEEEIEARLKSAIIGRWITSFDLQFPDQGNFIPTAFLSCFHFRDDGTYSLYQHRNKGGVFDHKNREGTYSIGLDSHTNVPGGSIAIYDAVGATGFLLHFYMRSPVELHWIMETFSVEGPIPGGALPLPMAPVAQGTMYKVEWA